MSTQNITAQRCALQKLSREDIDLISGIDVKWHRSILRMYGMYCTINIDGCLSRFKDHEEVIIIDMTKQPWMKILGSMHGSTQVNGVTSIIKRHELKSLFMGMAVAKVNDHYVLLIDYDLDDKERLKKIAENKATKERLKRELDKEYDILCKSLNRENKGKIANYRFSQRTLEFNKIWIESYQNGIEEIKKRRLESGVEAGLEVEIGLEVEAGPEVEARSEVEIGQYVDIVKQQEKIAGLKAIEHMIEQKLGQIVDDKFNQTVEKFKSLIEKDVENKIQEKDRQIELLKNEMVKKDRQIETLENEMVKKDQKIQEHLKILEKIVQREQRIKEDEKNIEERIRTAEQYERRSQSAGEWASNHERSLYKEVASPIEHGYRVVVAKITNEEHAKDIQKKINTVGEEAEIQRVVLKRIKGNK